MLLVTIPFSASHGNGLANLEKVLYAWTRQYGTEAVTVHVAEKNGSMAAELCGKLGFTHSRHDVEKFDANMLRNAGPREHQEAEFLLWTDQDMVPQRHYAACLVPTLRLAAEKKIYVVVASNRRNEFGYPEGEPVVPTCEEFIRDLQYRESWSSQPGNNIAISAELYGKVGEWDEAMHSYGAEDMEFSYRLAKHAILLYYPRAAFLHLHHEKNAAYSNTNFKENWIYFLQKYGYRGVWDPNGTEGENAMRGYRALPDVTIRMTGHPYKLFGFTSLSRLEFESVVTDAILTAESAVERSQVRGCMGVIDDVMAAVDEDPKQRRDAANRLFNLHIRCIRAKSVSTAGAEMAYLHGRDMLPLLADEVRSSCQQLLESGWRWRGG